MCIAKNVDVLMFVDQFANLASIWMPRCAHCWPIAAHLSSRAMSSQPASEQAPSTSKLIVGWFTREGELQIKKPQNSSQIKM
jgi:hypothetical protein